MNDISPFNVGDKVRAIDMKNVRGNVCSEINSGGVFTVAKTFVTSAGEYVVIKDANGELRSFFSYRFELLEKATEENTMQREFKIGDVVKCIKGSVMLNLIEGYEYVITSFEKGTTDTFPWVKVEGIPYEIVASRFELIISENIMSKEFKIGDVIQCINDPSLIYGRGCIKVNTDYVVEMVSENKKQIRLKGIPGIYHGVSNFKLSQERKEKMDRVPTVEDIGSKVTTFYGNVCELRGIVDGKFICATELNGALSLTVENDVKIYKPEMKVKKLSEVMRIIEKRNPKFNHNAYGELISIYFDDFGSLDANMLQYCGKPVSGSGDSRFNWDSIFLEEIK
jgi:hypothetical protein